MKGYKGTIYPISPTRETVFDKNLSPRGMLEPRMCLFFVIKAVSLENLTCICQSELIFVQFKAELC